MQYSGEKSETIFFKSRPIQPKRRASQRVVIDVCARTDAGIAWRTEADLPSL